MSDEVNADGNRGSSSGGDAVLIMIIDKNRVPTAGVVNSVFKDCEWRSAQRLAGLKANGRHAAFAHLLGIPADFQSKQLNEQNISAEGRIAEGGADGHVDDI